MRFCASNPDARLRPTCDQFAAGFRAILQIKYLLISVVTMVLAMSAWAGFNTHAVCWRNAGTDALDTGSISCRKHLNSSPFLGLLHSWQHVLASKQMMLLSSSKSRSAKSLLSQANTSNYSRGMAITPSRFHAASYSGGAVC